MEDRKLSAREVWYDEEIAPRLLDIARLLKIEGMSLVAVVEFENGRREITRTLAPDACVAMNLLSLCATTGENVDAYMIGLARWAKENGIDTTASMYLNRALDAT